MSKRDEATKISRTALAAVTSNNGSSTSTTGANAHWLTDLPDGWVMAPVGNLLCETETSDPKRSERDEFVYIDIQAIDNKQHRITSPKTLPTNKAPSRARRIIQTGDVITSLVRPYLKNTAMVGRDFDG